VSHVAGTVRRYWRQRTPLGDLTVVSGDAGIIRIALPGRAVSPTEAQPERDDDIANELDEYFAGERRTFTVPVDLSDARGFRREVLETLHTEVPYGETVTYGELAEMAGRPRAARAVGTAMATCPAPIVLPCHRVVASGGIGGYGGGAQGVELKRTLLALEGVHLR
jgi:methylated-DNA-[protein]-cysteine S-methyltransferase